MLHPLYLQTIHKIRPRLPSNSTVSLDGSGYLQLNPTFGPELVINGGFDTDTVWTKGTGWTITGGEAVASATTQSIAQDILTSGKPYVLFFELVSYFSGNARFVLGITQGINITSLGVHARYNYVTSTPVGVTGTNSFSGAIDDVSVKEIIGGTSVSIRVGSVSSIKVSLDQNQPSTRLSLSFFGDETFNNRIQIVTSPITTFPFRVIVLKFLDGVQSTLIATTLLSFVDGAEFELLRINNNTFAVYYNSVQVGTNLTINDQQILNGQYLTIESLSNLWKIRSIKIDDVLIPFHV